jgi:hypothetical protein
MAPVTNKDIRFNEFRPREIHTKEDAFERRHRLFMFYARGATPDPPAAT